MILTYSTLFVSVTKTTTKHPDKRCDRFQEMMTDKDGNYFIF